MSFDFKREYTFECYEFDLEKFVKTAMELDVLFKYESTEFIERTFNTKCETRFNKWATIEFGGKYRCFEDWDILEKLIPRPYQLLFGDDVEGKWIEGTIIVD